MGHWSEEAQQWCSDPAGPERKESSDCNWSWIGGATDGFTFSGNRDRHVAVLPHASVRSGSRTWRAPDNCRAAFRHTQTPKETRMKMILAAFLVCFFLVSPATAQTYPQLTGRVVDQA